METLTVALKERSYPIEIGSDLPFGQLIRNALPKTRDVMIVSNETVALLYLDKVVKELSSCGFRTLSCLLKDGEKYKTFDSYLQILTSLLKAGFSRDGAIAALGGGVIGDIAGFAASTYQRGIAYVQMPTTLLAMVDSSVGGKTAVNHEYGKNMIGTFYQPRCVAADIKTLKSLPQKEMAAGFAEVIKYGIIYDKNFFEYLYDRKEHLLEASFEELSFIVRRCCEIKACVVSEDEKEQGLRAILNLGHTFGHAIEAFFGFGTFLHGEAVAIGMNIACTYACQKGAISPADLNRIRELLLACKLPVDSPKGILPEDYLAAMHKDKKVRDGRIVYVIPKALGCCETVAIDDENMRAFLGQRICV